MKIAAQHPKRQGVAAGINMKKRLLFDRIALEPGDIAEGHAQLAALVEAHLANAAPPGSDKQRWPQARHRTRSPSARQSEPTAVWRSSTSASARLATDDVSPAGGAPPATPEAAAEEFGSGLESMPGTLAPCASDVKAGVVLRVLAL